MGTEYDECVAFAEWCNIKRIKFSHIPNETYTKSWNQKRRNKRQGVSRGFPDYCIIVNGTMLFIEMKRPKKRLKNGTFSASNSKVSPEQETWLDEINTVEGNIHGCVCYGCDEAVEVVLRYLK